MTTFGIPKKYLYISLVLFAFNMFVAAYTFVPNEKDNVYSILFYYMLPLLGAVMGGSLLGFLLMLIPAKNVAPEIKYTRAKIMGVLLANALLVIFYIYILLYFLFTTNG